VILLHPADSMNPSTQNALLKSLEEPGPHTFFLLATSQPHRLLATVRSRCQAVPLPRPTRDEAVEWLKGRGVDDPLDMLALAGGAPLLAAAMASEGRFIEQFADRLAAPRMDTLAAAASVQTAAPAAVVCELYRWCYDLLSARLSGRVRYHTGRQDAIGRIAALCDPVRLAAYSRTLCEARALAAHPLNARLFVEELLIAYSAAVAGGAPESQCS
jgi:DNA polymerase-3 subunit delta'